MQLKVPLGLVRKVPVGIVLTAMLCGCGALGQPMSPAEFRQTVGGSSLGSVTSFDAALPYRQVAETLRKKANECLAVATSSTGTVMQGNMAMRETSHALYKPTLSMTEQQMELAVQVDFGAHTTIQKKPDGGFYILVADAVPAGANTTKVTIYRGVLGKAKDIGSAIHDWSTGASSTCPNLGG
jgi:hypothetical protein